MFSPFLCESSFTFNNNKLGGKAQRFRQRNTSLMNKIASRKSVLQKREACIGTRQNNGFGLRPTSSCNASGLCIYKDIACKRVSLYQNGTTKHCLQKRLCQSELSIPLATVILDSSKIFQEAAAVTAKQVQIGDRPCRIYGTDYAEYLLLQMTDEHE